MRSIANQTWEASFYRYLHVIYPNCEGLSYISLKVVTLRLCSKRRHIMITSPPILPFNIPVFLLLTTS
jgi:hypothetical protein